MMMGNEEMEEKDILPLFELPDLVLDKIWKEIKKMDLNTILTLQQVSSYFADTLFPIEEVWPLGHLGIMSKGIQMTSSRVTKDWNLCYRSWSMKEGTAAGHPVIPQPLTEANLKWLSATKELEMNIAFNPDLNDFIINS